MWIEAIRPCFGSLETLEEIRFRPGVNVIRGENGIGKTTILEFASLLGHVALMDRVPDTPEERVEIRVAFEPSDREFLAWVKPMVLAPTVHGPGELSEEDALLRCAVDAFRDALSDLHIHPDVIAAMTIPEGSCTLSFVLHGVAESELKDVLSSDAKIRNSVKVHGAADLVPVVKLLNCWNRPFCAGTPTRPGPWTITPAAMLRPYPGDAAAAGPQAQCGATFYINTDMYEFGAGLDVRESPKELRENLEAVLINRLQLIRPRALLRRKEPLADQFQVGDPRSIDGLPKMQAEWRKVFKGGPQLQICKATRLQKALALKGQRRPQRFSWNFTIGGHERREFVSSGENQALFVLAMLANLAGCGSCVLIDEPELHLTFAAGTRLVKQINELASDPDRPLQVIIVTHLPHLYRDQIPRHDDENSSWPRDKVHFIYLPRSGSRPLYGNEAVNAAAQASHTDVLELALGLKVDYEVPILFWVSEAIAWLKARASISALAKARLRAGSRPAWRRRRVPAPIDAGAGPEAPRFVDGSLAMPVESAGAKSPQRTLD